LLSGVYREIPSILICGCSAEPNGTVMVFPKLDED
jgi:hypothetical protein